MIADSLISDDDWSEAPDAAREAFLFLANAAREKLRVLVAGDDAMRGPHSVSDWRRQYIWELTAVATQLGVDGLPAAENAQQTEATRADFDAQLARVLTTIKAEIRHTLRTDSVVLAYHTKTTIREHLDDLRMKIDSSNLSEKVKAALHDKVDAVEAELNVSRSGLRPFWLLAGALSMATTTVGGLSDLPGALKTIESVVDLVHNDKAVEDNHETRFLQPRLTNAPIKQIEDHSGN